eukprot:10572236-Ditylum_brightwellii.AAC.1
MWTEINEDRLENDESIWVMLLEIEYHMSLISLWFYLYSDGCVMHQPVETKNQRCFACQSGVGLYAWGEI